MARRKSDNAIQLDIKDVISLTDLALRFAKAKGMDEVGYQWMRQAPGRGSSKDELVGNSLAVIKSLRAFNAANKEPISVFNSKGYDGTNRQVMVLGKKDIIRLKGFILRGASGKPGRKKSIPEFKITGRAEI
jgi:hypothetical protein